MIISNNLTLHKFNKWLKDSRDMMESVLEMGHKISLSLKLMHKVRSHKVRLLPKVCTTNFKVYVINEVHSGSRILYTVILKQCKCTYTITFNLLY